MRTPIRYGIVLASAIWLASCSSAPEPEAFVAAPSLMGDSIQISLAQLLQKPRSELAEMCSEWVTKVNLQSKAHSEGRLHFTLLPKLHLPVVVPVCREMTFDGSLGFSAPPYATGSTTDAGLALLFARYGDAEAAGNLAGSDRAVRRQIAEAAYEHSYPVEWTRLVALLLHEAQLRLATGDIQGGTELVVLHKQLREVLDSKAARGPLGAALLGVGHQTLTQAEAAWRGERKLEIANQATEILKEWGDIPELATAVSLGASRADLNARVGGTAAGRILAGYNPLRWLDLLELPFPADGANAAWACFDKDEKLQAVYISYEPRVRNSLPTPRDLAWNLEERPEPSKEGAGELGLLRRTYQIGAIACAVTTIDHGTGMGAYVRLGGENEPRQSVSLRRDFGALHLDRSFEQNRLQVFPEDRADTLVITKAQRLAEIVNLLPALKLGQAVIQQATGHDLVSRISLEYPCEEESMPAPYQFALPLWAAFGPPAILGEEDPHGGHLAFSWGDDRTRCSLWLPYENGQPIKLQVMDSRGAEAFAQREAEAAGLDKTDRKQRLQAGKPLRSVTRQLDQFELGMTRGGALGLLPGGSAVLKQDIQNGVSVTFTGDPATGSTNQIRQIFLFFDSADRLREVRVRYVDGPASDNKGTWTAALLNTLKKHNGAPAEATSTWTELWSNLQRRGQQVQCLVWKDDVTVLSYQRDRGGVEVTLCDASENDGWIGTISRLAYLPDGPENCLLGTERKDLLQKWSVDKPTLTDEGALVLRPGEGSAYDALLVWFENDRACRIVARHAHDEEKAAPARWAKALNEVWSREGAAYGWPRRVDTTSHNEVQGLGWHDDEKQIYVFWQESSNGTARVYREWRQLKPR